MTDTSFAAFGLADTLVATLANQSITTPTPIQAGAIPPALAGRDVLGVAQTGTGKTAAFSLPLCDSLIRVGGRPKPRSPKALILAPTRELASQIGDSLAKLTKGTKLSHRVIFGGVGIGPQIDALRRGVDILVATPGRLVDLMGRDAVLFNEIRHVVLDEADRMLDMGFVRDVMRIVDELPARRHSALFSATMPNAVVDLAKRILTDAERVEIEPEVVTVEAISQTAYAIPHKLKKGWLIDRLKAGDMARTVVFARTKHGANRLAEDIEKAGVPTVAIHGNKSQAARQKALSAFQTGRVNVLVATDIIARGIHVDDISHVVNYELPEEPESYVHRIGRTARAGKEGIALSLVARDETAKHRSIERLIDRRLPLEATGDGSIDAAAKEEASGPASKSGPRGRSGNGRGPSTAKRGKNGAVRGRKAGPAKNGPAKPRTARPGGRSQRRAPSAARS